MGRSAVQDQTRMRVSPIVHSGFVKSLSGNHNSLGGRERGKETLSERDGEGSI